MRSNYTQLIIGSTSNEVLFMDKLEVERFIDYIKIYSKRFGIILVGFSFEKGKCHIIFKDLNSKGNIFIEGIINSYKYYLCNISRDIRLAYKTRVISNKSELINILRYICKNNNSSLSYYKEYSRYLQDDLVKSGYLMQDLYSNEKNSKAVLIREVVKEPEYDYICKMKKFEIFEVDKMTKRRKRSEEFLLNWLKNKPVKKSELLLEKHRQLLKNLIKEYREKTDLSYRDIGHTLGISHTSVIRIYNNN